MFDVIKHTLSAAVAIPNGLTYMVKTISENNRNVADAIAGQSPRQPR